ncbi:hypothetical protein Ddc_22583 [Ditylenchus destructor]|nr:hypothetical protein Ddc_22583 [Ditylenchus destructor]
MVEAFKYLNYCQLAKNSLVSKRFLDVIQTHRHRFALLYVDSIRMERCRYWDKIPAVTKIFNKELSLAEYNEWIVRNNYSKQIPLNRFGANVPPYYELDAYGDYKGPNLVRTSVFFARVEENNREAWPLFEHFIRLFTDPFVNIRYLGLISQPDVLKFLAATMNRNNRGRLQCEILCLKLEGNVHNFLSWIKDHVRCASFQQSIPDSCCSAVRRKQLFDFFATGSHCASEIVVIDSNISKAIVIDFVQKFLDLKNCDESHIVNSIRGKVFHLSAEALMTIYKQSIIKEEKNKYNKTTAHVFEFVNVVIRKKFQLTITNLSYREPCSVKMEIMHL